jgi:hypothetical protein
MPPAMTASNEAQLLLAIQRITFIEREIEENKREAEGEIHRVCLKAEADAKNAELRIKALEDERNKALRWGISTLGLAVVGMATWIVNLITGGHIK